MLGQISGLQGSELTHLPSYELESLIPSRAVRIVAATELLSPYSIRVLFWLIDPEQQVIWPNMITKLNSTPSVETTDELGFARYDGLWQNTCFELFLGVDTQAAYREVNLSPAEVWNCYQFDDYRKPDQMPPVQAHDIQLFEIQAQPQKLHAVINVQALLEHYQCQLSDLRLGLSSVLMLKNGQSHFFALQHTGSQADFHRKQDWTARL